MKIVIIGAGFTGGLLARSLVAEGNSVVLVDNDPERVRSAGDQLDCTVVETDGKNLDALEKVGISSADALVALTGEDEDNAIICSMVDAVYPEIYKIARVRDYDHYSRMVDVVRRAKTGERSRPVFGIDNIVNPDVEAAGSIVRAMEIGAAGSTIEVGRDYGIAVLPLAEGCPLDGKKLSDLPQLEGWNYLVAFVKNGEEIELAKGSTVLKGSQQVGILAHSSDIPKIFEFTGTAQSAIGRVAIFGADNVSALVLQQHFGRARPFWSSFRLFGRARSKELLVIDRDIARCRDLAARFPSARILNGDITDDALLQDEAVSECDLMVAASGNYERNLMSAAYLKLRGVGKAIALTSNSAFDEIAAKLGVDVTVAMRDIVIDAIMSHLKGRNIKSVHSVGARKFEIVTCEVSGESKVAGKSLSEIGGLENSLVLLTSVGDKAEIPKGSTVLEPGMSVVLIVPTGDAATLEMFAGKPEMLP